MIQCECRSGPNSEADDELLGTGRCRCRLAARESRLTTERKSSLKAGAGGRLPLEGRNTE